MTAESRNRIITKSFLIRTVEERLLTLFQEGKLSGTVHTCIGQELIGATVSEFLNDNDLVLSNHRGHGHFLARNNNLEGFFAEIMGKENGICGGIGGSQHFYTKNHISNGIQGGMTPIAAGIAMANKLQKNNEIVVCFIGDGTLGEGIIYEAFNIASLWDLPIVFVLENNGIAQSTATAQTFSGTTEKRAEGFGLKYYKTNTWNLEHLHQTFKQATTKARTYQKAVFVEVETYRLGSHSKSDDNRNPADIKKYIEKDLLNIEFTKNKEKINTLLNGINKTIEIAVQKAEKAAVTKPKTSKLLVTNLATTFSKQNINTANNQRINQLIHNALKEKFSTDSNSVFIGEDIAYLTPYTKKPYGGAFKVSGDLSEHYQNVKNTPISEAAIVGIGTGLALKGMAPIIEIMFGDFMTLTFDQLYNHACKFAAMSNYQIDVPLVIRTPMGGKRGYGPTHSQSLEKFFLGIPNLLITVLNYRIEPKKLYKAIFSEKNPTIVIENKVLYTKKLQTEILIGYQVEISTEKYPTIKIKPENKKPNVTILCYGEMLEDVEYAIEMAFDEEEIFCEIICPSQISPLNMAPILASIQNTKRLLIVEEGTNIAAYSAEVAAQIMQRNVHLKSFKRLSNNEIIPSSMKVETEMLPNPTSIFNKIQEMFYE